MQSVFSESDLQPYLAEGTAGIIGQAFLRTRGGDVKYGAGQRVMLFPATPYFEEWFDGEVVNETGFSIQDWDVLVEISRKYKCGKAYIADASGNFAFGQLPSGKYLIWCKIEWQAGYSTTGGYAYAKVEVGNGQIARAMVTR
jgi:hypothetical protein